MTNAKHHVVTFIRAYREEVQLEQLPFANRRLAAYRRAATQACSNRLSVQRKLARCRKPESIARWQAAAACWQDVQNYFAARIHALGEPF